MPCIIGSQIMGAAAAYDWDDVPEISIYSFLILLFVEILQTVFPRSFTAGESFLISAIIIQLIRWVGTEANIQEIVQKYKHYEHHFCPTKFQIEAFFLTFLFLRFSRHAGPGSRGHSVLYHIIRALLCLKKSNNSLKLLQGVRV